MSSSTRTVAWASSPDRARKGMDDGTKRLRCRRYRRGQGQGGCVHSLIVATADVPEHHRGAARTDPLASQTQGRQGSHGGFRRLRARLGQGVARGRHRSPDRRPEAGAQLRPIGRAARQERCDRCGDDRLVRRDLHRRARPNLRCGTRQAGADREGVKACSTCKRACKTGASMPHRRSWRRCRRAS